MVGKTSTEYCSMAAQIAAGERSSTVMSVPAFEITYSSVFTPPMWSNSRKASMRRDARRTANFASSGTKSCTAALLFPVDPEEKRIKPGCPIICRRTSSSCVAVVPVC